MRYKSTRSMNLGDRFFLGVGGQNLYRDKDFAQFYVKHPF